MCINVCLFICICTPMHVSYHWRSYSIPHIALGKHKSPRNMPVIHVYELTLGW